MIIIKGAGLLFSPLHAIIPFLMMGIGVDDMFVIIQALHNIEETGEVLVSTFRAIYTAI